MAFNSTIISKKKKCKTCNRMDYIFSGGNCRQCSTIKSTAKRADKAEQENDDISFKQLVEECDEVFSKLIRIKYSNEHGMAKCYTSGVEKRYQELQCGHFISRKHYATRWMEENARCQTEYENCHKHGNLEVFKANLEKEKKGITDYLLEQSREVTHIGTSELKELLTSLRYRLKLVSVKLKK